MKTAQVKHIEQVGTMLENLRSIINDINNKDSFYVELNDKTSFQEFDDRYLNSVKSEIAAVTQKMDVAIYINERERRKKKREKNR